jgi:hypothetical protein
MEESRDAAEGKSTEFSKVKPRYSRAMHIGSQIDVAVQPRRIDVHAQH